MRLNRKNYKIVFEALQRKLNCSYAPYSKINVVSMVETDKGNTYFGANVENKSYGLTICAERIAVFNAIINDDRGIERIFLFCPIYDNILPCGSCLQVMSEFCHNALIISFDKSGLALEFKLSDLFPKPFAGFK